MANTCTLGQVREPSGDRRCQKGRVELPNSGKFLTCSCSLVILRMKMASHLQLPEFRYITRPLAKNAAAKITQEYSTSESALQGYYLRLLAAHGPQHWWPGRTRFEVIVGAILTQNTAWVNVERALRHLRRERLLTPAAIDAVPSTRLARLIRSSGYFRQKTETLKAFVKFLRKEFG